MKVQFLEAGVPLVKRFTLDPVSGSVIKTPYPHAYEFTSHAESPVDLPAFAGLLARHGAAGHCLLKGLLGRALIEESRAGSTDANQLTTWICLDLDGVLHYTGPDAFLADQGLGDISYILQWSASQGLAPGLRCHIFMLLEAPQHPTILKLWLQHRNLASPTLRAQTALTKTGAALMWPLDTTTCQNDKLIYIAAPTFTGITDPFPGNRVQFQKRLNDTVPLSTFAGLDVGTVRGAIDVRINELRVTANMPKRKPSAFKLEGTVEYLSKPGEAVVTSHKVERGFVYLNLNGGDSFAYYHPVDNPKFLYNFKGEPTYLTEEISPSYYAAATSQARTASHASPRIYLAFRDLASDTYWNGWYDEPTNDLVLHTARTEGRLRDFLAQHGQALGDFVPDWNLRFDPHDPTVVDLAARRLNTFRPSPFMKQKVVHVTTMPPVCGRIIEHVLGDDPIIVDHFNNWMACILQKLDRTYTGWILHGRQGTGKGLLVNRILMPIFGEWNMTMKRMEELEGDFTGFFENIFLAVVDEIQTSASLKQAKITSKLKNLMVEPFISVRRMYREAYMARNYCNMIFTSNMPDPVVVAQDDRRFNVGNYQRAAIQITAQEIEQIDNELYDMYCFWMSYPIDQERAKHPLRTAGRQELIETNMQASDVVAKALLEGDMRFFFDQLPTDDFKAPVLPIPDSRAALTAAYKTLIKDIVDTQRDKLSRDDLMTIFRYTVGKCPDTPNKFTSYLKHQGIHMEYVWRNSKTVRGIAVRWAYETSWLSQAQAELG